MAERKPRSTQRVDKNGVKIVKSSGVRRSVWLLSLAMMLVGAAVFIVIRPTLSRPPAPPPAAKVAAQTPGTHAAVVPRHPRDIRQLHDRIPPTVPAAPPPAAVAAAPQPQVASATPAAAGGTEASAAPEDGGTADEEQSHHPHQLTGIAAFPPPGTKPIKRGIIVPDDVQLPPGYVRHYQTTDDGQQLPPILMFHPDYHPVDAHGNPIPLPKDRVVPPDMAPPGMPIEMLQVPAEGEPVTGGPAVGRRRQDANGNPPDVQTGR